MRKKSRSRAITYFMVLFLFVGALAGCGGAEADDTLYFHSSLGAQESERAEPEADTEAGQVTEGQELYLVVAIDQIEESLRLYRYANGMEYRYYYGTGTRFYDRYGTRTTVMSITAGSVITLGDVNREGILREASVSDQVWVYDDITRFSVEEERGVFEVAGSRYRYDESTYVFSGDEVISMSEVLKGDTLSVVGLDRQILSVNVTTGQGVLELQNTELFEGSYLQLGTKIFAEITADMQLAVEEGTYELIVANNGWGGSREVTVARGETTTVDLDELKGEGPKIGKIRFVIDVEDAVLVIDGKERDYSEPLELTYGEHALGVVASGYELWERNLYVNSEEATIVIQLNDDEEETVSTSEASPSSSESESSDSSSTDALVDAIQDLIESQQQQNELDTLKDLLTSTVV